MWLMRAYRTLPLVISNHLPRSPNCWDEGKTELTGAEQVFALSVGFDNGGGGLLNFNRALAARVAAY